MKINGSMLSNKFVEQIYFPFWCFYQDLTKLIWTSISYSFRNVRIFSTVSWLSYDAIHTNPNQKRVLSTIIFKWNIRKLQKYRSVLTTNFYTKQKSTQYKNKTSIITNTTDKHSRKMGKRSQGSTQTALFSFFSYFI